MQTYFFYFAAQCSWCQQLQVSFIMRVCGHFHSLYLAPVCMLFVISLLFNHSYTINVVSGITERKHMLIESEVSFALKEDKTKKNQSCWICYNLLFWFISEKKNKVIQGEHHKSVLTGRFWGWTSTWVRMEWRKERNRSHSITEKQVLGACHKRFHEILHIYILAYAILS